MVSKQCVCVARAAAHMLEKGLFKQDELRCGTMRHYAARHSVCMIFSMDNVK